MPSARKFSRIAESASYLFLNKLPVDYLDKLIVAKKNPQVALTPEIQFIVMCIALSDCGSNRPEPLQRLLEINALIADIMKSSASLKKTFEACLMEIFVEDVILYPSHESLLQWFTGEFEKIAHHVALLYKALQDENPVNFLAILKRLKLPLEADVINIIIVALRKKNFFKTPSHYKQIIDIYFTDNPYYLDDISRENSSGYMLYDAIGIQESKALICVLLSAFGNATSFQALSSFKQRDLINEERLAMMKVAAEKQHNTEMLASIQAYAQQHKRTHYIAEYIRINPKYIGTYFESISYLLKSDAATLPDEVYIERYAKSQSSRKTFPIEDVQYKNKVQLFNFVYYSLFDDISLSSISELITSLTWMTNFHSPLLHYTLIDHCLPSMTLDTLWRDICAGKHLRAELVHPDYNLYFTGRAYETDYIIPYFLERSIKEVHSPLNAYLRINQLNLALLREEGTLGLSFKPSAILAGSRARDKKQAQIKALCKLAHHLTYDDHFIINPAQIDDETRTALLSSNRCAALWYELTNTPKPASRWSRFSA